MHRINRRTFLQKTLATTAGAAISRRALAQETRPAAGLPQPCAPTAWKKHGVVLAPTEPIEGNHIQNFNCPVEPLDGERWRLWFSAIDGGAKFNIAYAEGLPGEPMKKFFAECSPGDPPDAAFAIGNLPDDWKPVQVVHIHLKNGRHRIYFWVHGPRVIRFLAAESDDGRRYRVLDPHRPVLYHPSDRATWSVPTPDGLLVHKDECPDRPANEPLAPSRLLSNDSTNVYQLADGSFEMYSVALVRVPKEDPAYIAHDNAPGLIRLIDRYTSDDGLHFENRKRVVARDANDPADQQFYHLNVTHTLKGRVGMLGHYRVEAQTMDLEWCFSPDGPTWHRPLRRAWLPRGEEGQPDSYGIYPPAAIVHRSGKDHLFYTAVNYAHNQKHAHGPMRTVVMYATTDSIWA